MSTRKQGGLYRIDEHGQKVLVHRSKPGGIKPPETKKDAPKARPKKAPKVDESKTGGDPA